MPTSGNGHSSTVAQASGMVSVQATCTFSEAIALMLQAAGDTDSTLNEIAALVIEREVRFGG